MAINAQRVVVGGLAAGVVTNILGFLGWGLLMGPRMNAEMDAVVPGLSARMATGMSMSFNIVTQFAVMMLVVWLYAAMRPRFGPGFKTAAYAALAVWVCGILFYQGWYLIGMMSSGTYLIATIINGAILLAGAYVGGMLYKEEEAPAGAMASARP